MERIELEDGSPDNTLADSLVNRDATTIYFYLQNDTVGRQYDYDIDDIDSIAWIRFVWGADDMEAQLPGGQIVNTFEEFNADIVQWNDGAFYWAKLSIDLGKIAPHLFSKFYRKIPI